MTLNPADLKPGEEQYEGFYSAAVRKTLVQYDYRAADGTLFSTVAKTLTAAREKRDRWEKGRGPIR